MQCLTHNPPVLGLALLSGDGSGWGLCRRASPRPEPGSTCCTEARLTGNHDNKSLRRVALKQAMTRVQHAGRFRAGCVQNCIAQHPSKMSVEAMMTKAFAVSLKPPNTRLMVRNSCPRPSLCLARMAKPSRPDVLSATTFSRHCQQTGLCSACVAGLKRKDSGCIPFTRGIGTATYTVRRHMQQALPARGRMPGT